VIMKPFKTPQEAFWAGEAGDDYIQRNQPEPLLPSKTALFSRILARTGHLRSVTEFGCNIGINLSAISRLLPDAELCGIEINPSAVTAARQRLPGVRIIEASVLDWEPDGPCDLAFTSGLMIHINPEALPGLYGKLAEASRRYVMLAEYYNPSPLTIHYRGQDDRLYKRDFAGEFLAANPEFCLMDYGFVWRRDPVFPLDDVTWFLMKRSDCP
jgi:pseudaminic acid biosynthesis-associated methylase